MLKGLIIKQKFYLKNIVTIFLRILLVRNYVMHNCVCIYLLCEIVRCTIAGTSIYTISVEEGLVISSKGVASGLLL